MTDLRSAEQRAAAEAEMTPQQRRNARRSKRRLAAKQRVAASKVLSNKPTRKAIRAWRKAFREWQRAPGRAAPPKPPRRWLWGLVEVEPWKVAKRG